MKKITKGALFGVLFALPMFTFAQGQPVQLLGWISSVRQIINLLIPIAITLIFLAIIWNAYKMITADGEEKSEYRGELIKMIVIFFVVLSIYGIVYFIGRTLGIGQGGTAAVPCVTGSYNQSLGACT